LSDDDLQTIASDVSLNLNDFSSCQNDSSQTDEVKKDLADAGKVGASGTPTFFIGKSSGNGVIQGERLVGAHPFSAFESIVNKYSN
jgi:predicted DsbA family dithiol-disulfide isomerase